MDEIRGLTLFGEYFKNYKEQYVLIGGVAYWLTMSEFGEKFRATKDLDIVIIIETLTPDFVNSFWEFIKLGNYEFKQVGGSKPIFYRFQKPKNTHFPVQIELFSRSPYGIKAPIDAQITFIPTDEGISSLSAILLDDDYYAFLKEGLKHTELLSFIGVDRLIPFKMSAWLDLSARKYHGEKIDSKVINKHRNDVIRLSALLTENVIIIPQRVYVDINTFLTQFSREIFDPRTIGINASIEEIINRIKLGFGL